MNKDNVSKAAENTQAAFQTGALPASAGGQNAAQAAAQTAPEAPAAQTSPKRYAVAWNSGLPCGAACGALL